MKTNTIRKKNIFSLSIIVLVAIVLLLAMGWYFYRYGDTTGFPNDQNNSPLVNDNQTVSDLPTKLVIPSIGVNANVIQVGLTADGAVDTPKGPAEVAWYNLGPRPGDKGSAIITGHYGEWISGAHSVFDNLNKLKKGDKIEVIDAEGKITTFQVRELKEYDPSAIAPEIFNKTDGTYLNLITCQGEWLKSQETFTKRLVVFSELVK